MNIISGLTPLLKNKAQQMHLSKMIYLFVTYQNAKIDTDSQNKKNGDQHFAWPIKLSDDVINSIQIIKKC